MPAYRLGGCTIRSSLTLPELAEADPVAHVAFSDVEVLDAGVSVPPPAGSVRLGDPDAAADLRVVRDDERIRLWLDEELTAVVTPSRSLAPCYTVRVLPAPGLASATLRHLLLDQVLPRVLFHAGRLVLHAGAALMGQDAWVALGESGVGKSCFTAACHALGGYILSDDAVVLELPAEGSGGTTTAWAWYPGVRLDPASHGVLLPGVGVSAPLRGEDGKRRIALESRVFRASGPLKRLFLLERGASCAARVEALPVASAVAALASSLMRLVPTDRVRGDLEFRQLTGLLGCVRAQRLCLPEDLFALGPALASVGALPPPRPPAS